MPRIHCIVAFIAALSISVISGFYHYHAREYLICSVQVIADSSLEKPILQIFYDKGKGFVESDSRSFILNKTSDVQNLSFTVNSNTLYGLRLDVLNGPGEVIIKSLQLSSNSQKNFFTLNLPGTPQLKQIASVGMKEDGVHVVTLPSANDPYLLYTFQTPVFSPEQNSLINHTIFTVKTFMVLFLGILLVTKLTSSKEQ